MGTGELVGGSPAELGQRGSAWLVVRARPAGRCVGERKRGVLHCSNPVLNLLSPSASTLHLNPLIHRPISACDNSVLGSSLHQRIFHALWQSFTLLSLSLPLATTDCDVHLPAHHQICF